ncbi:hypothetical protein [Streptomyces albipurpureus]|uniref:Uncharacterized protein n=1 Tax=Streptomyces albipurpureus TaxID=2897419 RepID=A0ABT0UJX6_9ACTN|nr:hypothetical protein [Streptomyces sp. CWNU-1]MCM2388739.1 hypothetical protein [Streptomyces sp. CWNU-1]
MSDAGTDTIKKPSPGAAESGANGAGKHRGVAAAAEDTAAEPHGKHRRPGQSDAATT